MLQVYSSEELIDIRRWAIVLSTLSYAILHSISLKMGTTFLPKILRFVGEVYVLDNGLSEDFLRRGSQSVLFEPLLISDQRCQARPASGFQRRPHAGVL